MVRRAQICLRLVRKMLRTPGIYRPEKGVVENELYFAGKANFFDLPKVSFFKANPQLYPIIYIHPDKARVAHLYWKTEGPGRFRAVLCPRRAPLPAGQDGLSPSPLSLVVTVLWRLLGFFVFKLRFRISRLKYFRGKPQHRAD